MPDIIIGLAPVISTGARLLILGSMPGAESLRRGEYYAHPRNIFWNLIEHLFDIARDTPYPQRLEYLKQCGIAVWDVVAQCRRQGSLDTAIEHDSVVPNDFRQLFHAYPSIDTVCFNGQKAAALYRKLVLPLEPQPSRLVYHTLPSTSPANATPPAAEKRQRWIEVLSNH